MAKFDPTRSITLRRRFSQDASRRYLNVRYGITSLLQNLASRPGGINVYDDPQGGISFEGILRQRLQSEFNERFAVPYMTRGYVKGVRRAYLEAREADEVPVGPGSKFEFIQRVLESSQSNRNTNELLQRVRIDLDAINEELIKQATNEVAEGIARGDSLQEISKAVKDRINKIGRTRSKTLAHTAIVRAHSEGQLDSFQALGVRELSVEVEWMTARFPCPLCKAMKGIVLPIEKTRGLIPRHPNCRCRWKLVEDKPVSRRRRRKLRRVVRRSLKAERAKSRRETQWPGSELVNR